MSKFKAGDKVSKKNGTTFSNGAKVVTVAHHQTRHKTEVLKQVWFKETKSQLPPNVLLLVEAAKPTHPNPPLRA